MEALGTGEAFDSAQQKASILQYLLGTYHEPGLRCRSDKSLFLPWKASPILQFYRNRVTKMIRTERMETAHRNT